MELRFRAILTFMLILAGALSAQTPPAFVSTPLVAGSEFGAAIVTRGDSVFIGAPGEGAAYLFDRSGLTQRKIYRGLGSEVDPDNRLGSAIAVFDTTVFIGAPLSDLGGTDAGAIYVVGLASGGVLGAILNPTPARGDSFGLALTIAGGKLIVGAPRDDAAANNAGAVHVFNLATLARDTTIQNPVDDPSGLFGFALAALRDDFIVGAYSTGVIRADAGAAYFYDGADYTEIKGLHGTTYDNDALGFGFALAATGRDFIVGSLNGNVYLLTPPDGALRRIYDGGSLLFGRAVAGSGPQILVGDTNGDGSVFHFDSTSTNPLKTFASNVSPGELFGQAVSFFGNNVLAGAPGANNNTGAVYMFEAINRAPVLTPIGYDTLSITEGESFSILLQAADPDDDSLRFATNNLPGFGNLTDNGNGTGTLSFAPSLYDTGIYSNIQIVALDNGSPALADTVSFTLTVIEPQQLVCQIEFTSPQEGFRVQNGLVLVAGEVTVNGPGTLNRCTINAVTASIAGNQFSALVPLPVAGKNLLIAQAVVNAPNDTLLCVDSLSVFRVDSLVCTVNIVSPDSGAEVFGDSVNVCLQTSVSGGHNPSLLRGTVNGQPLNNATPPCAQAPVTPGRQTLLAQTIHLDRAASDSFGIALHDVSQTGLVPQIVHAGVEFNAGRDANNALIPIAAMDADQNGIVEISVPASTTANAFADITFPAASFGPGPTQVWIAARTGSSLNFQAFDETGTLLAAATDTVRGNVLQVFPLAGGAIRRIEIIGTEILISELSYTGAVKADTVTSQDSTTVTVFPVITDVVLNEISFDPNYDDLGAERIELKNLGSDSARFDSWALFAVRDTLVTGWKFPRNVVLAPESLLVVHWLAKGTNDAGNLFTGVPSIASPDSFFDNNSTIATNMTLGGVANDNSAPFALFLMQLGSFQSTVAAVAMPISPPRLVDFVQIGNIVPDVESFAAQAGLWRSGDFLAATNSEGYSYELRAQPADSILTSSSDYFRQANPSLGFANKLVAPPEQHLLISEICVRPSFAEFIEIYNPGPDAVSLKDYYLTDNVTSRNNAYTLLTTGLSALQIEDGDFFVRFPATAVIPAGAYQTVAFSAKNFAKRYSTPGTPRVASYEIVGDDNDPLNDVRRVKPDTAAPFVKPGFADPNEALILLHWDGKSDLVEDVDYVVWGDTTGIIEGAQAFEGEAQAVEGGHQFVDQAGVTIAAGPLNEAVNKTGLGIDGADSNAAKSYYDADTHYKKQKPVDAQTHALLKSWQRRPKPKEFGELQAGGNGLAGHDETSENLASAFKEDVASPNGASDQLDLIFVDGIIDDIGPNGTANGYINPAETIEVRIRLKNRSDEDTGPLFSVLRAKEPLVMIEPDSIAYFPNISPDSSVFSSDVYVFSTKDAFLPDTLYFTLLVVQKTSTGAKSFEMNLATVVPQVTIVEPVAFAAFNAFPRMVAVEPFLKIQTVDTLLLLHHQIKNDLQSGVPATQVQVSISNMGLDPALIESALPPLVFSHGTIPIGGTTEEQATFSFKTKKPFMGREAPHIVFNFSWRENNVPKSRSETFNWASLNSFTVKGILQTANGSAIAGTTVKLESANAVRTATTGTDGTFTLVAVSDTGAYKITATRFGVPLGAINPDDRARADELATPILSRVSLADASVSNVGVYERIAANVGTVNDNIIAAEDVSAIDAKLIALCWPFPNVGKDWTFVDAHKNVAVDTFSQAPRHLSFVLKHFHFEQMDLVGIVYGDVLGDADPALSNVTVECPPLVNIAGKATYFQVTSGTVDNGNGLPVMQAMLTLDGAGFVTEPTITNGTYTLMNVASGYNYTLRASKPAEATNVDSEDLALLDEHLLDPNATPLTLWQLRAADVNQDEVVNDLDQALLRNFANNQRHLGIGQTSQWRFYKPDLSLNSQTYVYTPLLNIITHTQAQNFVAVLLGDVTGDWGRPSNASESPSKPNGAPSEKKVPQTFFLSRNYPNPFNPATTIEYGLPREERVLLQIFNTLGQLLYTCVDGAQPAGYYEIHWNGVDQNQRSLPSGVYLVRFKAGAFTQLHKLAFIK